MHAISSISEKTALALAETIKEMKAPHRRAKRQGAELPWEKTLMLENGYFNHFLFRLYYVRK